MTVLFVYSVEAGPSLRTPLPSLGGMPFGIAYISASLAQAGVSTALVVLSSEQEAASLAMLDEALDEHAPEVVAFTCVSSQFPFMRGAADAVKRRRPSAYRIIGGPHVSLNPEEALASAVDAVCIGEGEYPMLELVRQLQEGRSPQGISNLWLKRADGAVERNPPRPFVEDLEALPFPDREMWRPWVAPSDSEPPSILLGRGCPFLCSYCCNHALRKLAPGRYVRLRSPQGIVREVQSVRERLLGENPYLFLEVETIGVHKAWTLELCAALRDLNASLPQAIKYHTNFRIAKASLDSQVFRAMAEANFRRINIGLEAGSERVRREILKRDYTNAEFLQAVRLAREHGMEVNVFNMVGIPGETPADHMETVRLNRESRPNLSYTSIFFPYPGTDLYRVCRERGRLGPDLDVRRERKQARLDSPEFPRRSVQRAFDLFDWRIHRGHWPWHVRFRKLVRHYIGKSRIANRVFLAMLPLWRRLARLGVVNRSFGRNT